MTSVRRLFVFLVGYEFLPKSISTKNLGSRFIMSEPICCYLLDTASGWILLDAGLDPRYLRDPALTQRYFHSVGIYPPVVEAVHELPAQLEEIGLTFSDIHHVVLSHLHLDHAGYLKYLTHARISIQRREHEFGLSADRPISYFLEDYDLPELNWHLVEGDWEVVPGLEMLSTRGHTPGHQSAVIELPKSGTYVLPFDAGDLQENFDQEILPGECCDDVSALTAIRRLKSIVAERNAQMILFHDPVAIQTTRLAPDFYE